MCENCEEVKHVKFPNMCKTPGEMYEKLEVEHHSLIPILNFHNDQTRRQTLDPGSALPGLFISNVQVSTQ